MKWHVIHLRLFLDVINNIKEEDEDIIPILMESLGCAGYVKKLDTAIPEEALFLLSRIEGLFPEHRMYIITDAKGQEYIALKRSGGFDFYSIEVEE